MKCKFCGMDAGFFSRSHKECEEKHNRGIPGMTDLMRRYFSGGISANDLGQKLDRNRLPYNPYTDGLEIHKDEAKQKRIVFEGFDPWFTMNALNLLNS